VALPDAVAVRPCGPLAVPDAVAWCGPTWAVPDADAPCFPDALREYVSAHGAAALPATTRTAVNAAMVEIFMVASSNGCLYHTATRRQPTFPSATEAWTAPHRRPHSLTRSPGRV